jgi:peptide deformylase
MAILKIARMGHPVLRHRAEDVADPTAPTIRRLVADMGETLTDAGGVGLAAPQVHAPLRLVIFSVPPARADSPEADAEDGPVAATVLINPMIEAIDEARETDWESCLSLPGLSGAVPRYRRIRYAGLDLSGGAIERIAAGFHARVVQHEVDHLDGVLFPMRMTDLSLLMFTEEMRHGRPEMPPRPA